MPVVGENWNCANNAALTCQQTWTKTLNGGAWSLDTNTARLANSSSSFSAARCETDIGAPDMIVEATLTAYLQVGGLELGVAVRYDASASTFYLMTVTDTAVILYRVVNGSTVTTLDSVADSPVPGDRLKLAVTGTQLVASRNGVVRLSLTDTGIVTGTRGGIGGESFGAADIGRLDDWLGTPIVPTRVFVGLTPG